MASDDEKKATDGDMATTMATMQDAILKKMEEGFAALEVRILALEEKVIGDGLVIKPANLQPLASSGVAATLTAPQLADTVTTSVGLPTTNLLQFSQQFPSLSQQLPTAPPFAAGVSTSTRPYALPFAAGVSTSTRPYAPQLHQAGFPSFASQQRQSFPNIWPPLPPQTSQR
jgi:hypothetical protein